MSIRSEFEKRFPEPTMPQHPEPFAYYRRHQGHEMLFASDLDAGFVPGDDWTPLYTQHQPAVPEGSQGAEAVEFEDYDPGPLNDWGGGNVPWWMEYIRTEVERANEHWREQLESLPLYTHTQPQAAMPKLEWSLAIDRIVPDLSPEPDQNEYPAEWSVWADRQRVRRELSLLSAPPSAMVMINEKPIQRRPSYGGFNMEDQVIEKKIDDSRSAKVTWNEYGCQLLTLNNGRQWSGAAIYSVEVAEAAIEVLKAYVKQQKGANNGGGKRKMMFDDMQIERVARAICTACDENPDHSGDCRGNDFRWQDYREAAIAAIRAVRDVEEGPGDE